MARKRKTNEMMPVPRPASEPAPARLLEDLRGLIRSTRAGVASTVNAALVVLYWEVGRRIRTEVLKSERATYGDEICSTLSNELIVDFGKGFSRPNLTRMIRFAEVFPDREVVAVLARQLGWSHFVEIIYLKDPLQRDFYAEMCRIERWSVRTLRAKIGGMLFERTALSKKPDLLIEQDLAKLREDDTPTPDLMFRDPNFLNFLGLKDTYSEKDLEAAILREMEQIILELGAGFTFVAPQKRFVIDGEVFHIDLLFYHRKLRRLIAVELKLERFRAADKGQMELYLRWLEKYEKEPDEEAPIGLILCADKGDERVELLQLDQSGIRVASYLTDLPPRQLLQRKLHEAMIEARARLEGRTPNGSERG
jgi:predicted nuclease of restriction endonuclease-like (RecB) superfamily